MIEEELPVRREVEIRAGNRAQLELRLHGFERALALRSGYIIAVQERCSATGQYIASISYELTLPEWLSAGRSPRRARRPSPPPSYQHLSPTEKRQRVGQWA